LFVGLEPDAKPVIEDAQSAIPVAYDGLRHHGLDFLRHHADIGTVAAVIAEAIVAEPIRQMTEQNDIVFDRDIRPPAAAAATTATPAATAAAEATATTTAAAAQATAAAPAGKACAAARGVALSDPTGPDISKAVAAASSA